MVEVRIEVNSGKCTNRRAGQGGILRDSPGVWQMIDLSEVAHGLYDSRMDLFERRISDFGAGGTRVAPTAERSSKLANINRVRTGVGSQTEFDDPTLGFGDDADHLNRFDAQGEVGESVVILTRSAALFVIRMAKR